MGNRTPSDRLTKLAGEIIEHDPMAADKKLAEMQESGAPRPRRDEGDRQDRRDRRPGRGGRGGGGRPGGGSGGVIPAPSDSGSSTPES